MNSFPRRPPYLNREVYYHEAVEDAASILSSVGPSTMMATATATATATAREDDDSSRNVASSFSSSISSLSPDAATATAAAAAAAAAARAASGLRTLNGHVPGTSSLQSSSFGSGLEKISEANGFVFFHWHGDVGSGGGGEIDAHLDEIEALVEEAWAHDYRKSNQARFVYTKSYLEWFTQGDCCDFLLAREVEPEAGGGGGGGRRGAGAGEGELVACLAVSKRVFYLASEKRVVPICYGTLLTVSPRHRKRRLALTLHAVVADFLGSYYSGVTHYMGAFDGDKKNESFKRGVYAERERVLAATTAAASTGGRGGGDGGSAAADAAAAAESTAAADRAARAAERATVMTKTRLIPFWACTRDLAELLRYMPLSSELLTKVILSGPVRRLLEFSFRQQQAADADAAKSDYRVCLVEPRGISYPVPGSPETTGFVLNETLSTLYGTGHPNVAGTYRVDFLKTRHFAEVSFIRHVIARRGLSEHKSCVQIQIVDRGDTTRAELCRALKIVCDEFFEWKGSNRKNNSNGDDNENDNNNLPCIAVLMQNWIGIPAVDLLRIRFLPSDRKVGFQVGRYARNGYGAPEVGENLLFDLV